ncbi:hypothetical protein P154DRAFT_103292 [Amniculicola lignicola CBS 123094]|uniref:FAM192A/Fyv6 N-terminal domain-containing protein n=1 Tax=Amniculicola lignicola CBS 123094 TaxID=1392246 RepID=A0A6A5WSZ6_9PLEO|nr:hypothetical protein P154DRAFT_103292 [Amniculicola lignicola CBS 123094]
MASGFVSGGTIDKPIERDEEWQAAQREIEEKRQQKAQEGMGHDGKSLFDVLQENKAAKQSAFEEAARLKNQYRALDDDEAEYLDGILESTRQKEAVVKKETLEQLDLFRKQREEAEKKAREEQSAETGSTPDEALWKASARKRKKGPDTGLLRGIKLRKGASGAATASPTQKGAEEDKGNAQEKAPELPKVSEKKQPNITSPPAPKQNSLALGLGYGSSDEDD